MCADNCAPIKDLVTVVTYGSKGRVVFRGTPLASTLHLEKINFVGGGTDFSAGLTTVETELKNTALNGLVPVLLFMSDGGCDNGEAEMTRIHANYPALKLFVVGFGSACDTEKLQGLATQGGGQLFFGADGNELRGEFEAISIKISGGQMAL